MEVSWRQLLLRLLEVEPALTQLLKVLLQMVESQPNHTSPHQMEVMTQLPILKKLPAMVDLLPMLTQPHQEVLLTLTLLRLLLIQLEMLSLTHISQLLAVVLKLSLLKLPVLEELPNSTQYQPAMEVLPHTPFPLFQLYQEDQKLFQALLLQVVQLNQSPHT